MNSLPSFSAELAQQLIESSEQFPIDFDDAWMWLGYGRKDNAKASFLKCGFVEGIDFEFLKLQELRLQGGYSNREQINLTCDCLKQWGMMAGTEKGKQVRFYFLECERKLKESRKPMSQLELILASAQQLVELDRRQRELEHQNILLAEHLQSVQLNVNEIQNRAAAAEKELKALPPAAKECPKRTTRTNINTLVRTYCHATTLAHKEVWNNLYREFRDRYHVDLKIRAANGNCKPLDLAEALDVLDDLYAVAKEIMGGAS